jgi:hypothetical protein
MGWGGEGDFISGTIPRMYLRNRREEGRRFAKLCISIPN